jgi:hypothetical protein
LQVTDFDDIILAAMERRDGQGRPGASTSREQGRGKKESKEHQSLPSVWEVLERKVRITEARSSGRITEDEYDQERRKLASSLNKLDEKGTDRDRVIEELYNVLTIDLTNSFSIETRALSLDEFHQLRSKVEPMSDDEIREEICKTSRVIRHRLKRHR